MKLRWFAAAVLATGLGLGCTHGSQSFSVRPEPAPGLDTLRAALVEFDELERKYLLTSYLRTLRPADMPVVIAEVEKHRVGFDVDDVRLLMLAWTRFDGPGAFDTARNWPTPWKSVLMKEAMAAWGYSDGRAAHAACNQVEDEDLREALCGRALDGWVTGDDGIGAAEYIATVSEAKRRRRLAFRLTGNAKRHGPDAIIALIDGIPDDAPNDFKRMIFAHAGGAMARLDPERVAKWYEENLGNRYTIGSLSSIATKWSQDHDSAAAIAWIESLGDKGVRESERVDATGNAFRSWQAKAPAEAEAWLESASPGPLRDEAIVVMAKAISDASPAEALRWARQIDGEEERRRQTFRYTRRWFRQDPDAAKAWIVSADISDDFRQGLLNNLPRLSQVRKQQKAAEKRKGKKGRQGKRKKARPGP